MTTRRIRQLKRLELGERLRALPAEHDLALGRELLQTMIPDAQAETVAAFVSALAYECHCNYRMVASQAVFTKRSRNHG